MAPSKTKSPVSFISIIFLPHSNLNYGSYDKRLKFNKTFASTVVSAAILVRVVILLEYRLVFQQQVTSKQASASKAESNSNFEHTIIVSLFYAIKLHHLFICLSREMTGKLYR